MYKILLVEDDKALASAMKAQLESWGNEVAVVEDLRDVMTSFRDTAPQLVLLDIILPFFNGYHWCRQIRLVSNVPVVFISSASDNMNIVMAMSMGGDDFITKPVDPLVLTAKLQALLRRTYELTDRGPVLAFEGAFLDTDSGTIRCGDETIELTRNEQRILMTLLENRGHIVSRETLMMRLWQDDCYVEENTLTVNVARLRRRLEAAGLRDVIRTKPGSGYLVE